jgi:hypothetical protein
VVEAAQGKSIVSHELHYAALFVSHRLTACLEVFVAACSNRDQSVLVSVKQIAWHHRHTQDLNRHTWTDDTKVSMARYRSSREVVKSKTRHLREIAGRRNR